MEFLKSKHTYSWLHKVTPDVNIEQLRDFLIEDMVKHFIIFSNKNRTSNYIMHSCFVEAKQKCRCVKLSPHLVTVHKQRVNCNYFGFNSTNQFLWLLGKINRSKQMMLIYGKLNDITCCSISPSIINDLFQDSSFYDKKFSAISKDDFKGSVYYELSVNVHDLEKKEVDDMLLGCAENLDEDHTDFIHKLNNQTVLFIQSLLWKYFPFPLTDLSKVPDIYNSPYRYLHGNTPEYVKAILNFQLDYSMMSTTDYFKTLKATDSVPYFNVLFTYKSLSNSLLSLDSWFSYQFGDQKQLVIKQIYDLMLFKCGKKHCLWLFGDSGSGKSFVFNSLATLFLNVGYIGDLDPKNNFCYSDVPNKKIIMLDEPTIPDYCFNEFKNFFAGQPYPCNIKHKKAENSGKSFWIMLSNNDDVFDMTDSIWNSRIVRLTRLRQLNSEFLELHGDIGNDQIHPLAWLNLFEQNGLKLE